MPNLKIQVFKDGGTDPATTITIPGGMLRIASRLIPKKALRILQEKGIDLDEIVKIAENPNIHGTLVEIEEHQKDEKIRISLD